MKNKSLVIVFVIVLVVVGRSRGIFKIQKNVGEAEKSLEEVNLRLEWIHQSQFAGFYVADQKGFFNEAGLEVSINPGGIDFPAIQMVAGGNEEFGLAEGDQIILAREQGDQIIDPALVPETFEIEGIDTAQTVEFEEILEPPVLENFSFVNNPDGTVNVIGNTTNNIVGTFPNIEVASQEALNVTKQNRNKFIASSALQSSSINGLAGNGASTRIGQKVYDPINNLLDAKALANFDGQISVKRQKQIELEKKIEENEEAGQRQLASELMDNLDTTGLSIEELGQVRLNLETQLSRKQTVYPIQGQEQVKENRTLGFPTLFHHGFLP